jgi:phosphatidylglycerophosphate synthase
MRASISDIRRRAQRRTDNLYDTVFTRNISPFLTAVLATLGVSPNTVSFANFFVGVAGCVLIAFATPAIGVAVGVGLIHLYAVLDSVDGEIARLTGSTSLRGMFLEDWSAYALLTCFPLAISLYLQRHGAGLGPVVVAVLYAVLGRNAMPALRRAIVQAQPSSWSTISPVAQARLHGWSATVERIVLNPTNIRVVLTSLVLLHLATASLTPVVTIMFYVYMAALLVREGGILWLALQGDLVEREQNRLRVALGGSESEPDN